MSSGTESPAVELIRLELDLGVLELTVDECAELVRLLREKSEQPGGIPAAAAGDRLDVARRVGSVAVATLRDEELDAMADAAWEWLSRAGAGSVPERVLFLLDALRSRHARE
jgi:hypothetical protein